jgi:hypothetical protein
VELQPCTRPGKKVLKCSTNSNVDPRSLQGQCQRTIERAKITIFKANLRNHHDRVNHFPAFPSMICDFRSHNFFLGKVKCQFLEKIYTLLLHLFGAQNKTPQVFFRNVRQYCTNLCFNHCFVHLIRFLLGPCGPYIDSTQIWPPGDVFSTKNWFGPLRDRTKRPAKFLNTPIFEGPHGRVSHFPALSKHPLDLWRALWKFQSIPMSSSRDRDAAPNRWAFDTAPSSTLASS